MGMLDRLLLSDQVVQPCSAESLSQQLPWQGCCLKTTIQLELDHYPADSTCQYLADYLKFQGAGGPSSSRLCPAQPLSCRSVQAQLVEVSVTQLEVLRETSVGIIRCLDCIK